MTTELSDVLDFIASRATDADLDRIRDIMKVRHSTLSDLRAASIDNGMTVTTRNLSPKGLNGLTGEVKNRNGKRADLLLTEESTATVQFGRTRYAMPAMSTERYLLCGVPLSSMERADS